MIPHHQIYQDIACRTIVDTTGFGKSLFIGSKRVFFGEVFLKKVKNSLFIIRGDSVFQRFAGQIDDIVHPQFVHNMRPMVLNSPHGAA